MSESVSNVYDLAFPSPVTLKEISFIVVAVELWREEICAHLESTRLHELDLKNNIALKNAIPSLPSTIYSSLEAHVDIFRKSIVRWLDDHHKKKVFTCYHEGSMNILSRFHDFAWDWDGRIHDTRTAKRMISCDRLDTEEKFMIACIYCLEDDIKRIWPSVSAKVDLNQIDFETCPQQYYWIRYFRNELHMVLHPRHESVDEMMLVECSLTHESAKHFWNRLPSERQTRMAIDTFGGWLESFARFILSKLSAHQLETFLAAKGADLIVELLFTLSRAPICIFRTWMFVRNDISSSNFIIIIKRLLTMEAMLGGRVDYKSICDLSCEIWESAPPHLKRSVLSYVLPDDDPFLLFYTYNSQESKGMKLLITVLQDATFEERSSFWRRKWSNLICGVSDKDLSALKKLFFENENEFTLFRENTMCRYENISGFCVTLLREGLFNHLNDFLSICCPDVYERRELKQQLLRSNYLGENSALTTRAVKNNKLLGEFIDDAFYDAADLGVEFRNQFTTSPRTNTWLFACIRAGKFTSLKEFVDFFFTEEQVVVGLKKRLVEDFKQRLIAGGILYMEGVGSVDDVQNILIWLLGGEDGIIRFKQSLSVDDIFRGTTQLMRRYGYDRFQFPTRLNDFLVWYFNGNEEEIEELKKRFPDDL